MNQKLLSVFAVVLLSVGCGPSVEPAPGADEGTVPEVKSGEGRVYEMALCGSGLDCSASNISYSTGCQQYTGGPTIYCCPSGWGISNGACVPPCGSGLKCTSAAVYQSSACQQYKGGPTIYCCPSGYGLVNNSCVPPCGWGVNCGATYVSGATTCVTSADSTTAINCCAPGKTYTSTGCR